MKHLCYRCSEKTDRHVKVVTSGSPKGRWMWWCGCGESKNNSSLIPRHEYDCGHCKFNWCCGPLCQCGTGAMRLPKAPPHRRKHVAQMLYYWRHRPEK